MPRLAPQHRRSRRRRATYSGAVTPRTNLSKAKAGEDARALRKTIEHHNELYYIENRPEISDEAYDKLFRRLEELEARFPEFRSKSSPTQRVGAKRRATHTVEHAARMLSLHAAADEEEVARFHKFVRQKSSGRKAEFFLEPKFDGVSVELVYKHGRFRRASTRGDGQVGDEVSGNLVPNQNIPNELHSAKDAPAFLALRGEAYLSKRTFQEINKARVIEGLEPFANPRNAVAGMLHRQEPDSERTPIHVIIYDVLKSTGAKLETQHEVWRQIKRWGFENSVPAERADSLEKICAFHHRLENLRDQLRFEIDGIVIKSDNLKTSEALGTRHRSPRGALAWKFAPREEITLLEEIVVQVGKSGALTPVALLAPVDVGGVTVSRATLHNEREIHRKDLRPGDSVRVKRAGDVIPEIAERIKAPGRRGDEFSMPQKCPACGTKIVREGINYFCPAGIACRGQLICCLVHFASREALNIDGLGSKTATQLVEHHLVKDIADLYHLTGKDFLLLPGFAVASANKLKQAIERAKHPMLDRFLYALAIRHIGQRTAHLVAQRFGSLKALRHATEEEITELAGPVAARKLYEFFANRSSKRLLARFERYGVEARNMPALKLGKALAGRIFVFTGTLPGFTREEAREAVEARGGAAAASVSSNTDYVVAGPKAGTKRRDAERLGIRIIKESEFRKILQAR